MKTDNEIVAPNVGETYRKVKRTRTVTHVANTGYMGTVVVYQTPADKRDGVEQHACLSYWGKWAAGAEPVK